MGLRLVGKTSSVVAYYYYRDGGRAASLSHSAGSKLLSTTTRTTQSRLPRSLALARTSGCDRPAPPRVLYVDRGVIVLNKPPGLVSQGTASSVAVVAPVAAKSHHRQETTTLPTTSTSTSSRTAFDDVLDGTVTNSFLLLLRLLGWKWKCLSANLNAGRHLAFFLNITFRSPTGLWPQYESVSGPSTRQGTERELKGHRCCFLHSRPSPESS